jgi:hypothetical protein
MKTLHSENRGQARGRGGSYVGRVLDSHHRGRGFVLDEKTAWHQENRGCCLELCNTDRNVEQDTSCQRLI